MTKVTFKIDGPKKAKTCLVLTHGTGESSDSTFLSYFAEGIAANSRRVVRFDFPYMAERSTKGRRRPPDSEEVLLDTWRTVLKELPYERIIIGGKAMGGRMATMIADECGVNGVLCLGYPFHPSGRPEKLRIEHLETLATPTLIIQGEQDPFGNRDEVAEYKLSESIRFHWVPDGDHSYNVGRGSDRAHEQNLKNALRAAESFLFECWGM